MIANSDDLAAILEEVAAGGAHDRRPACGPKGQLSRIDLEQLGNEETAQLLTTKSKLLRG